MQAVMAQWLTDVNNVAGDLKQISMTPTFWTTPLIETGDSTFTVAHMYSEMSRSIALAEDCNLSGSLDDSITRCKELIIMLTTKTATTATWGLRFYDMVSKLVDSTFKWTTPPDTNRSNLVRPLLMMCMMKARIPDFALNSRSGLGGFVLNNFETLGRIARDARDVSRAVALSGNTVVLSGAVVLSAPLPCDYASSIMVWYIFRKVAFGFDCALSTSAVSGKENETIISCFRSEVNVASLAAPVTEADTKDGGPSARANGTRPSVVNSQTRATAMSMQQPPPPTNARLATVPKRGEVVTLGSPTSGNKAFNHQPITSVVNNVTTRDQKPKVIPAPNDNDRQHEYLEWHIKEKLEALKKAEKLKPAEVVLPASIGIEDANNVQATYKIYHIIASQPIASAAKGSLGPSVPRASPAYDRSKPPPNDLRQKKVNDSRIVSSSVPRASAYTPPINRKVRGGAERTDVEYVKIEVGPTDKDNAHLQAAADHIVMRNNDKSVDDMIMIYFSSIDMPEAIWENVRLFLEGIEGTLMKDSTAPRKISIVHETIYKARSKRSVTNNKLLRKHISEKARQEARGEQRIDPAFHKVVNCFETLYRNISGTTTVWVNAQGSVSDEDGDYAFYNITRKDKNWWYSYFLRTPPCARGRFSQKTGGCWFSTVLNCLLLTEPLRDLWKNVSIPTLASGDTGFGENDFTKLSRSERLSTSNANDQLWNELVGSNINRDRYKAVLLNLLHERRQRYIAQLGPNDEQILFKYSKILNPTNKSGFYSFKAMKRLLSLLLDPPETKQDESIYESYDLQRQPLQLSARLENATKKIVLFGYVSTGEASDQIPLSAHGYRLVCSSMDSIDHAIAGLFCKGTAYVYDSNNISANTDWHKGLNWEGMGEYYRNRTEMFGKLSIDRFIMKLYDYLMYVKIP